jgi:hypothetical protein
MLGAVTGAVRFFWTATAGHRLRPWRSEYLRWRVETYSGKPAASLRPSDFLQLFVAEPHQVFRFFRWSSRLQRLAHGKKAG